MRESRAVRAAKAGLGAGLLMALLGGVLAGCSPALNWREVTPEAAALRLMFPCKPEREERTQPGPEGRALVVRTLSCKAQGGQFSMTWVDLGSAREVPAALQRLHNGLAQVLVPGASAPLSIGGMTPDPAAGQQRWMARAGQAGPAASGASSGGATGAGPALGQRSGPGGAQGAGHDPGQVRQAIFAKGPRVYQLLLQGARVDDEAWDVFVGSVVLSVD